MFRDSSLRFEVSKVFHTYKKRQKKKKKKKHFLSTYISLSSVLSPFVTRYCYNFPCNEAHDLHETTCKYKVENSRAQKVGNYMVL